MISERYANAYTEVLEILNHLSEEELSKIPEEKIDFYKQNKNNDYEFKFNTRLDYDKQNISREANAILVSLYLDYFATEEEKIKINEILDLNLRKEEVEKRIKYNKDDIFKTEDNINKEIEPIKNEETINNKLIKTKESFFVKFKNFIFKLLHINEKN